MARRSLPGPPAAVVTLLWLAWVGCAGEQPARPGVPSDTDSSAPLADRQDSTPVEAERFAPGTISTPTSNETWITFSRDGTEAIFSRYEDSFDAQTLLRARRLAEGWSEPEMLAFSGGHGDRAAYVGPDGRLYFSSNRPLPGDAEGGEWHLWVSTRRGADWDTPIPLPGPINDAPAYHAAVAANGTVYWASSARADGLGRSDLYVAENPTEGVYGPVRHLGPPVNTPTSEPDLYIDPQERFMILAVTDRDGGYGGDDLWLSQATGDGWTEPVNLGSVVNTAEYEYGPFLHAGWLYFTSHRGGQADIYRVRIADVPALADLDALAERPAAPTLLSREVAYGGGAMPVTLQVPAAYRAGTRWPAILALHGGGSRGSDGVRHRDQSVAAAARAHPDLYPAVMILPQNPAGSWLGPPLDAASAALDLAEAELDLDRERTYVVGQSMGAAGALALVARNPGRFAAAIAVAGPEDRSLNAADLGDTPVWLFHGTADRIVAIDQGRRVAARLRDAGVPVRWTEREGEGHDIFDAVYADPEVSAWLFDRRR